MTGIYSAAAHSRSFAPKCLLLQQSKQTFKSWWVCQDGRRGRCRQYVCHEQNTSYPNIEINLWTYTGTMEI